MNQDSQMTNYMTIAQNNAAKLQMDLEFVQSLADPGYIRQLLWHTTYLNEPEFQNYLQYLSYLRTPEYILLVKFPHSLQFLEILQQPHLHDGLKKALHPNGQHLSIALEQMSYMTLFQHTHELMPEKYTLPFAAEASTSTNPNLKGD